MRYAHNKLICLLGIMAVLLAGVSCQDNRKDKEKEAEKVYDQVDQPPEFPGGTPALLKYISETLDYQPQGMECGMPGRVIVQFVVTSTGEVKDAKVMRGINATVDKQALEVVEKMPRWIPGRLGGKAVNARYTIPITFGLY